MVKGKCCLPAQLLLHCNDLMNLLPNVLCHAPIQHPDRVSAPLPTHVTCDQIVIFKIPKCILAYELSFTILQKGHAEEKN